MERPGRAYSIRNEEVEWQIITPSLPSRGGGGEGGGDDSRDTMQYSSGWLLCVCVGGPVQTYYNDHYTTLQGKGFATSCPGGVLNFKPREPLKC